MLTNKVKQRVVALGVNGMSALGSSRRGRERWTRRIEVAWVLVGSVIFSCAAAADDCPPVAPPEPVVFDVDDLNGDGLEDVVIAEPPTYGSEHGPVVALSGADGSTLFVLVAPAGTQYFGMGVGRVEDLDGDGIADLAIASLRFNSAGQPIALLHIYSAVDGTPIALVSKPDDSAFTPADVRLLGDLNGDQAVDLADVLLLLDYLDGESPSVDELIADVNHNGLVDSADALALTCQVGSALDEERVTTFVTQLNQLAVGGLPFGQAGGAQVGLLDCVWCWIRCFAYMIQAANCADYCEAQYEACRELEATWEECECLVDVRRTCMPDCLAPVGQAAGQCAQCVWECAPRPRYR